MNIQNRLFELADTDYKEFNCKLIPNISRENVIGVRTPALRKLASEWYKQGDYQKFLSDLPHTYYEENNIHAFLIEKIKDYDECISAINNFLPYVDNWATCDMMSPKIITKNKENLYEQIKIWIHSNDVYTVRFGVKTLMSLYAGEDFKHEHIDLVASISSEEYYIKMAIAWYFATVLVFHRDEVIAVLKNNTLDKWTHNKTIQKVIESYRVSDKTKNTARALKR